jgi:hypothetical protein
MRKYFDYVSLSVEEVPNALGMQQPSIGLYQISLVFYNDKTCHLPWSLIVNKIRIND